MAARRNVVVSPNWAGVLAELCSVKDVLAQGKRRVVAVVGPKNVGKSTFARELQRRWQEIAGAATVGFLDTDLGRPEYTLPGMVSLHKHDRETDSMQLVGALYLGEDDPSLRPETYIEAARCLGDLAAKTATLVVVNTHGWFSGLGQDVLEAVLIGVGATDVVQIVPEAKMASLGSLLRPSQTFSVWTLAPAKEGRQRESVSSLRKRVAEPFSDPTTVYAVGFGKVKVRFPMGILDRTCPPQIALLALNASLVGMSSGSDETDPTTFVGMGLVLSVDVDRQLLFIQTPVPAEKVATVTCLTCSSTARLSLDSLPALFRRKGNVPSDDDIRGSSDEDILLPYRSHCKLVGFGSNPQFRGVLKRRKFDPK